MESRLPYEKIMRLKTNHFAMNQSYKRLKTAIELNDRLKIETAIGESLLWIVVTDNWLFKYDNSFKQLKRNSAEADILNGLYHAFNSLKHNMDYFQLHQSQGGFTFPLSFPLELTEINFHWSNEQELQHDGADKLVTAFQNKLVNKSVLESFESAITLLNHFVQELLLQTPEPTE